MKITRIEDVQAWQAARVLQSFIYDLSNRPSFAHQRSLQKQIQDASESAMANINEGFESGSDREFARFLAIAKRSAGEVQSHLYVAKDRGLISEKDCDKGRALCLDTMNLSGGFIRYLKKPWSKKPRNGTDSTRQPRARGGGTRHSKRQRTGK
jgi:four helix bundle protein